ncbi:MAG TPA: alpha/beta fold hydrolase [Steroidobacteraceae bacterium]|nr:alpha/beta fold hydrolase [Steroidobacteraceae bacterium]
MRRPFAFVMVSAAASCALWAHAGTSPPVRAASPAWPATAPQALTFGGLELPRCRNVVAYCGDLDRPLDPTGAAPGKISIHFEVYPHSAPGPAAGNLVATEGGPGYPATLSRDAYLALFEPLRRTRDVLIMDNRGTGRSGAIDCPILQTAQTWTIGLIAECGASLGTAAALYGTAFAADDLAAVLERLGMRNIDLYGDSYGTYFEQVFAARHPGLLRSIVLDGAYPLDGPDYAWYPSYAGAMRAKFDLACERFAPCSRLPGSSIDHIKPALELLRAHPFDATAQDPDGKERPLHADASMLATVMFASAPAFASTRELDAAARAFAGGDRAPLLRLMAETQVGVDSRDPSADPSQWSAGLSIAAICVGPGQIYDMRDTPPLRRAERDHAIDERKRTHPDTYAPFTIDEFRGMPLDYSFLDQCVEWPSVPAAVMQASAGRPGLPDVPVLVISGELDDITTPADGAAAAAAFKHGTQIVIANSFHVNALPHARSPCAAQIVRRFIVDLAPGDTACARAVPALRLVPRFARRAAELDPVTAARENRADAADLRWVSAALATVGDVLARPDARDGGGGQGLRGGRYRMAASAGAGIRIDLVQVRWTDDLAVSGTIEESAPRDARVRAEISIKSADGGSGRLEISWSEADSMPRAQIRGTIRGMVVAASAPAP